MRRSITFIFLLLVLLNSKVKAQSEATATNHMRLKFIDGVEIFAGPSLSFNHGNKFIENYEVESIENKRLLKLRYTVGIGFYHKLTNKIDLNLRLLREVKGTKSELILPENETTTSSRYTYTYTTLQFTTRVWLCQNKKWFLTVGGYYSKLNSLNGHEVVVDTNLSTVLKDEKFEGRYFVALRDDGTIYSSTWQPGLTGIEKDDFGVLGSIGFTIPISGKSVVTIQVLDSYGISNINRNNFFALKEKNHSISFLVAYTLNRSSSKH